MKKELVIEMLKKANEVENYRQSTEGINYYSTELDFTDFTKEDKENCALCQLIENDIVLLTDIDRSIFISYLTLIGKSYEQINTILDIFYRYNNIDLDYCYFGTYEELLRTFEYDNTWITNATPYMLKKEALTILTKILKRPVSLKNYEQSRDIRYGEVCDQLEFEEEAFKEDSKRMSEYTTADSYEITENYVCSYYNETSLSANFLKLIGMSRDKGIKCKIECGKDLQVFNKIALNAIKNMRLMRIPNIETFTALCQSLYVNDGYLTKSAIELFNSELNSLIKIIEDPECYKYIMMNISDLDIFEYSDCKLLYTKICKILDLTNIDIFRLFTKSEVSDIKLQFMNDILEDLDMEIVPYYDDNLDYQEEDEEYIPVMAE